MKRMSIILPTCLILLLTPTSSYSEPERVSVGIGKLGSIEVPVTAGADYRALGEAGEVFREYHPDPLVMRLRVLGLKSGTMYVVVAGKNGFIGEGYVVTVGNPPRPDDNPDNPDPPPGPTDPLVKALTTAYQSDTDPNKRNHLASLETVYRNARPENYDTVGKLFTALKANAVANGLAGKIMGVQTVASKELIAGIGDDADSGYDPALATATFTKIADALKAVPR